MNFNNFREAKEIIKKKTLFIIFENFGLLQFTRVCVCVRVCVCLFVLVFGGSGYVVIISTVGNGTILLLCLVPASAPRLV